MRQPISEPHVGRFLILAAAVMWSTSGFFAKSPIFTEWPTELAGMPVRGPLLAFWRAVFACLVLLPFVRRPRWTPKLIPMLLAYVVMNYTFMNAMTMTTEANAIWLQHTAPLWVFLVGVGVFGESVQRRDWWLLAFCLAGVGVILLFESRGQTPAGIVYGLLSGATYAAVVLSLRQLRAEDGAWLIMLNNAVTAAAFLPIVVYYDLWPTAGQTVYLAGFGVFQMGLPYLLFAHGLHRITGHEASGIVLLEPILVPVWVFLAWGHLDAYQRPEWWTLLGGSLILAGLAVRYLGGRRPPAP
jgi:drug/metabolite transporter (DMT)-like permease